MSKTLFEKVWNAHVVSQDPAAPAVLYIDAHLVHEVTSPQAFAELRARGLPVRRPEKTFATMDHAIPTRNVDIALWPADAATQVRTLRENCADFGITLWDIEGPIQGIVHVVGPEMGVTQPGMTIVCGDSHTSTHGAFGALAFGIGTSEVGHVLATQCLLQTKPKTMAITVDGELGKGVTAKDIILAIIAKNGAGGGAGYVFEYRGSAIRRLSMANRMTICNMSIEGGARAGMIAPDETTFAYIEGRPYAPKGEAWERAVAYWQTLVSDEDAVFDRELTLDANKLEPMVTYGTNPGQGVAGDRTHPYAGRAGRSGRAAQPAEFVGVHGPQGRPAHGRAAGGHRLHRLVHQRPHRGSAGGSGAGAGEAGGGRRAGAGGARLQGCEGPGGSRRAGSHLQRGGLRVARRGLQHVPGHERRQGRRGQICGQHLQPQLPGPPGSRRAQPAHEPHHGRGGGGEWAGGGCARDAVSIRLCLGMSNDFGTKGGGSMAVLFEGVIVPDIKVYSKLNPRGREINISAEAGAAQSGSVACVNDVELS